MKKKSGYFLDDAPTWHDVSWIYFSVDTSLSAFEDLLSLYEVEWVKKKAEIDKLVRDFRDAYQMGNTPHDYEQNQIYEIASRANFSVFLGAFSIMESFLLKICNQIQKEFDFEVKLADLNSRSYLSHYKCYICKVFGVKNTVFEKHYPKIKKFSYLRNVLIHSDGNTSKKDVEKLLNGIKGITILSYNDTTCVTIKDSKVFFDSFFTVSRSFLKDIHLAVENRYVQLRETGLILKSEM